MIIEVATVKVWKFIMLQKSNGNKNFVTNKHKLLNTAERLKQ
jgi:hypothetical protein